jgi:nucleotide-binding universal stress UspA family protein
MAAGSGSAGCVFAEIVIAADGGDDAVALAELLGRADTASVAASGIARDSTLLVARAGRLPSQGFVAVAPRGYADRPRPEVRIVGVGYVDSDGGRAALDLARGLAWSFGAEIRVIRIVPESNWVDADSGAGWRAVAAGRRLREIPGVRAQVLEGPVRRRLFEAAGTADLLVVGSRHYGALERLARRDLAARLARRPPCPLFVVPPAG